MKPVLLIILSLISLNCSESSGNKRNSAILGTYEYEESFTGTGHTVKWVLVVNESTASFNFYDNNHLDGGGSGTYTFDGTTIVFPNNGNTFTVIGKDLRMNLPDGTNKILLRK